MFEDRVDQNGFHYVVDGVTGHLAHTTGDDGREQAAVNLSAESAEQLTAELNGSAA